MTDQTKRIIGFVSLFFWVFLLIPTNTFASNYIANPNTIVEGFIIGWEGEQVKIEGYDGKIHLLPFIKDSFFEIDNRPAKPVDFKTGMEVYAQLKQDKIYLLASYSSEIPGYIPPGGKYRSGHIKDIDWDELTIKLPNDVEESYKFSGFTLIRKKGVTVPASALFEGDKVKLYFDDINTPYISRIDIQSESVMVKDIYRAKIKRADGFSNLMVLENMETLKNGKWDELKPLQTIQTSRDLPIYVGAQKIPYQNLRYYSGRTVYLAVKEFFGRPTVEKMIIKDKAEFNYAEKIQRINWFSDAFELANNKNISFHEGTMVIKNGRLIEPYGIKVNSDAYVIAEGRQGSLLADVMYIFNEEINHTSVGQNFLYMGRLNEIYEDSVILKKYYSLEQNEWDYHGSSSTKDLYYDTDTFIYDLEQGKMITSKEFFTGNYAVDEDSSYADIHDLDDWYGYVFTDGDRIAGILLQKNNDSLTSQRVSTGTIESINEDHFVGWVTYLKNSSDYSSLKNKWMLRNTSIRLNLQKALIIKDGKIITANSLQSGDRLYVVRDDFFAKVILVK